MCLGVLVLLALLCSSTALDQVKITLLSVNHFRSEVDSEYQCYASESGVSVESFRTGWTRDTASENPDPPDPGWYKKKYEHWYVSMINHNNNDAFGVFGYKATKGGKMDTMISTTRMRSDADIVPTNELFTKTVNLGDTGVTISMWSPTGRDINEFRWRHNNSGTMQHGKGTFTIGRPIQLEDSGIYECHIDGERSQATHGLNLLLVRACPASTWGPPGCYGVCNNCYNGGVCNENNGECVCPPGFQGENCHSVCGGNRFGHTCDKRCTKKRHDDAASCRNYLFCLIHPFGCRCNTGFKGLGCNTACSPNTFGASCLQSCHCTSGQCDRYTGRCTAGGTCKNGWTGDSCQECDGNFFGPQCSQACHCSRDKCNAESGLCKPGGCLPQWVDLFPPYFCQSGLTDITYLKVNTGMPVPIICTATEGPESDLDSLELILSRDDEDVNEGGIIRGECADNGDTRTQTFKVYRPEKTDRFYCQIRNANGIKLAVLGPVTIYDYFFDLPVMTAPPVNEYVDGNTIIISWKAWNETTDAGDPPLVGYIPYYKPTENKNWISSDMVNSTTLSFEASELHPETNYTFSVAAVREGDGGEGPMSNQLNVRTTCNVPPDPVDVITEIFGAQQELVNISWKLPLEGVICSSGVIKFTIYYFSSEKNLDSVDVTDPTATSVIIYNLSAGTSYTFYVTLTTSGGESQGSNHAEHLVPVLPRLTLPPVLESVSASSITISWSPWNETIDVGDPHVVGYIPYHKRTQDVHWIAADMVSSSGTLTYTATGLYPETKYSFCLSTVREGKGGTGPKGEQLECSTNCDVPPSPENVTTEIFGEKQELVRVLWEHPSEFIACSSGITKFTIYYSSLEGNATAEEVDDTTATFSILYNLTVGVSYTFYMTLSTFDVESEQSNNAVHLLPVLPILRDPPSLTDVTCNSVTTEWNEWKEEKDQGTPPILHYIPYHRVNDSSYDWISGDKVTNNCTDERCNFTFRNLEEDTLYDFCVVTVREGYGGEGDQANISRTTTTICPDEALNPDFSIYGYTFGGVLMFLLIAVLVGIWISKRKKRMYPTDVDEKSERNYQTHISNFALTRCEKEEDEAVYTTLDYLESIPVKELEVYIKKCESCPTKCLEQQFVSLNSEKQFSSLVGEKTENAHKNRFKNMVAYDHSRVVLTEVNGDIHSDYYNANYIKNAKGEVAYIAAQGPTKASVNDFWRMVQIVNVRNIVMLTNLIEGGKDRCFQYWPQAVGESQIYGDICVEWGKEEQFGEYEKRELNVGKQKQSLTIWHFNEWSDKDIPHQTSLIEFSNKVKLFQNDVTAPLLVHCSCGVGRTGTFIAIYSLMEDVKTGGDIDIKGFVEHMRRDRIKMVQQPSQYKFVHECLLEVYLTGDTTIPVKRMVTFDANPENHTLQEQFMLLGRLNRRSPRPLTATPDEAEKMRYPEIITVENMRPHLQCPGETSSSNYINASLITSHRKKNAFIATQSPLPNTIEDFWRLIIDWKCPLIVMLNQLDPNDDTCCTYWPETGSAKFGNIVVTLSDEKNQGSCIYRQFEVNHELLKATLSVQQMQIKSWDTSNLKDILSFIHDVVKLQQDSEMVAPTVVHCRNGVGRTGAFLTVNAEIERIEAEGNIDVFNTIRKLRSSNPDLVYTQEDYRLCYQLLKLECSESKYANM